MIPPRNTRKWVRSNSIRWLTLCVVIVLAQIVPGKGDPRQLLGLRGVLAPSAQEDSLVTGGETNTVSANLTVPLHAHSGTHHVHIYVGSPPQRQTLIVDTGSRVMAFPCKPCSNCGTHASAYFDPRQSSTYQESTCGKCLLEGIAACSLFGNHCEINQKYTEGSSWTAKEGEDIVWLGTTDATESVEDHMQLAIPYAFGCQTNINGLFQKQYADGILGLAQHDTSIVAAYRDAEAIAHNSFSLCLTPEAGYLSLGGSLPQQYHREPMKMTPIVRSHGWYSIEVVKVFVEDIEITSATWHPSRLEKVNGGKGCILDSGTTDTYLPFHLAKPVGEAVMLWTDGLTDFSDHKREKNFSFPEFQRLPSITLILNNDIEIKLLPKHYMEGVPLTESGEAVSWQGSKRLINRVYLDESEGSVLGANAMFGYDILFDTESRQVGIARADCYATIHSSIS